VILLLDLKLHYAITTKSTCQYFSVYLTVLNTSLNIYGFALKLLF